jgi:hypothetical protein
MEGKFKRKRILVGRFFTIGNAPRAPMNLQMTKGEFANAHFLISNDLGGATGHFSRWELSIAIAV